MKPKKAAPVVAPIDAKTFEQICAMPRDNVDAAQFWMITDGEFVTIAEQEPGREPVGKVSVKRKVFDAFVRWYMTGEWSGPDEC